MSTERRANDVVAPGLTTADLLVPFAPAEAFTLRSRSGEDFRISVGVPLTYESTDRTYPALYVLDGDYHFHTLLEQSRVRGIAGEVQEIVVVGIGYPLGTSYSSFVERREYDFSTAEWDSADPAYVFLQEVLAALNQSLRLGGALPLLEFLTEDLQPLIADRYRVDPSDQAIFGSSAGGNLVGQALFRTPSRFSKYIAASPAFVFNDWEVLRLEDEFARNHADLSATVYLGAGSEEILQFAAAGIGSGTARLAEALQSRGYPGLRLTCEFMSGKTHLTAVTEMMQRSLEVCWPGAAYIMSGEAAKELYRDLDK